MRTATPESLDQLGRRIDEMLAIVEDQKRALLAQEGDGVFDCRTAALSLGAHGAAQRFADELGVVEGAELDEPDAVAFVVEKIRADLESESRFSDAARPEKRHQTVARERGLDLGDFGVPANERRQLARQVVQLQSRRMRLDWRARRTSDLRGGLSGKWRFIPRVARRAAGRFRQDLRLEDLRLEEIAAPRHGLDDALLTIPQHRSYVADAAGQRLVRDDDIGPDRLGELILRHQTAGILDEMAEHGEALGPELDFAIDLAQTPPYQIEGEPLEKVDLGGGRLHHTSRWKPDPHPT